MNKKSIATKIKIFIHNKRHIYRIKKAFLRKYRLKKNIDKLAISNKEKKELKAIIDFRELFEDALFERDKLKPEEFIIKLKKISKSFFSEKAWALIVGMFAIMGYTKPARELMEKKIHGKRLRKKIDRELDEIDFQNFCEDFQNKIGSFNYNLVCKNFPIFRKYKKNIDMRI